MNVKKWEITLKYELNRFEVEALDKIPEDLTDAARWHNSKIFYLHANKLRIVVKPDLSQLKIVCDTLDVKEDLFWKEELATVLKGLKNNKTPGVVCVANEFLIIVVLRLEISY